MAIRPWYDQLREHEPLTPDHERDFCPECFRPSSVCKCFPICYRYLRDGTAPRSDRVTPRGSDDERAFVSALNANLLDMTTRLVFADWLDDHGRSDEAEVMRNHWASPIVTPFRVLPYWRKANFFARLQRPTKDPEAALLARRLAVHDEVHGPAVWVRAGARFSRIMILDDAEAMLAGIDKWPLLAEEMPAIIRVSNKVLAASAEPR
jgi:uncharacterized protein (TIGR02996 family)